MTTLPNSKELTTLLGFDKMSNQVLLKLTHNKLERILLASELNGKGIALRNFATTKKTKTVHNFNFTLALTDNEGKIVERQYTVQLVADADWDMERYLDVQCVYFANNDF